RSPSSPPSRKAATYLWTVGRLSPAISAAFVRVRPQYRSHTTSIFRRTCAAGWDSRSAFTTRRSSSVKAIRNTAMSGLFLQGTPRTSSSRAGPLLPWRMTRDSPLPPRRRGRLGHLLRLRLDLRDQLLEVRSAAEGVEVRLLQLGGKSAAGLDGIREGGDGLVGERSGLGGRHAGLRVLAQRRQ